MSTEGDNETSRKAALDRLRFRKTTRQDTFDHNSTQQVPANNPPVLFAPPPPQSRDASASVHYNPPSTPSSTHPIVLVRNSSPIAPEPNQQSYQQQNPHDAPSMAGPSRPVPWSRPTQPHNPDPLLSSSGFMNGGRAVYASFTRSYGGDVRKLSEVDGHAEDGPPRKRVNRGGPADTLPVLGTHVPDSPEIHRLGQRRRANVSLGGVSTSSEDSMPDIRHSLEPSATGRSRILRGQRPDSSEPTEPRDTTHNKDAFAMFRLSNIERDINLVQAAWAQAGGDEKKATSLLDDPLWKPEPKYISLDPPTETGRVVEVDEATKVNRAALREKARKSSIYANRAVLDTNQSTPASAISTSSILMVASPTSPSTPLVIPRRRRLNKVIVSDSDQSDSEDEANHRPVNDTEKRALDFLNTANT
ncbi:hypothetical protein JVT61DRAFT_7749 [Boletus reticuloceps]|uniref:Uncharacterized protein n=1 Tax=Boletus reticuloceps TaxID=495285 RepID=A0A8I2YHE3_9AGAM|nr:hypothetical protein JVT61DRAFT_7749 [Boletus reticuloceps]